MVSHFTDDITTATKGAETFCSAAMRSTDDSGTFASAFAHSSQGTRHDKLFKRIGVCEVWSLVEVRRQRSTEGLFCTKCDWSVVATHLPDILQDTIPYEVRVISGDFKNDSPLKAVAQLASVNLLAARKLLQEPGGFLIFTGLASKVATVWDTLKSPGWSSELSRHFRGDIRSEGKGS